MKDYLTAGLEELKSLKESSQESKALNEDYMGIDDVEYIYHNDWADPELKYRGRSYNENDVVDWAYADFEEDMNEQGKNPNNEDFDTWLKDRANIKEYIHDILDNLVPNDLIDINGEHILLLDGVENVEEWGDHYRIVKGENWTNVDHVKDIWVIMEEDRSKVFSKAAIVKIFDNFEEAEKEYKKLEFGEDLDESFIDGYEDIATNDIWTLTKKEDGTFVIFNEMLNSKFRTYTNEQEARKDLELLTQSDKKVRELIVGK